MKVNMDKHVGAYYIKEKSFPIKNLLSIVDDALANGTSNLANVINENNRRDIAFAFAVIAKELGVDNPEV